MIPTGPHVIGRFYVKRQDHERIEARRKDAWELRRQAGTLASGRYLDEWTEYLASLKHATRQHAVLRKLHAAPHIGLFRQDLKRKGLRWYAQRALESTPAEALQMIGAEDDDVQSLVQKSEALAAEAKELEEKSHPQDAPKPDWT